MNELIVQGLGFVAMLFCVFSYQFKTGRALILCKVIGDLIYVLHYFLLTAYSGCVTVAVCALNGLVCGARSAGRWADWKGWKWFFSVLLLMASLLVWRKSFDPIPSLCSFISILTSIWSTWSGNTRIIRVTKLAVIGPTFLVYCVLVRSYGGALCEIIGMSSAAIGLQRYRQKSRDSLTPQASEPCRNND